MLRNGLRLQTHRAFNKLVIFESVKARFAVEQNQSLAAGVFWKGLGFLELREDVNLPSGVRSLAISNGDVKVKSENGSIQNLNYKYQVSLMTRSMFTPCWQLVAAVNDPLRSLSYRGTTQLDGNTVHDVRVQVVLPGPDPNGVIAEYFGADFFIDAATFQVLMTQDIAIRHLTRKIRYSNYKAVNGVMVPFSIDQEISGRRTETIQLNQISFNTGLQDPDFDLQ